MRSPLIRPFTLEDRSPILTILDQTSMFTPEEIEVARELIDAWLFEPGQKDYILYTAEGENQVLGYVCYGPTPATEGTFDLYWIAVDPRFQREGVGKQLLTFTENQVRETNGRLLIIETSSQEKYAPTRAFYERNNYILEAHIRDFYRRGDDRLIYVKRF
ncbi:MAG TPA: GNAT family N-acetyltransferase [Spirochaetales bacterium]|nr:GNAT family N-acetyltransferase [Spirochaetales bacterium]